MNTINKKSIQTAKFFLCLLLIQALIFQTLVPADMAYGGSRTERRPGEGAAGLDNVLVAQSGGGALTEDDWDDDFDRPVQRKKPDRGAAPLTDSQWSRPAQQQTSQNLIGATIGSRGGQVGSLDAGLMISIPPGALRSAHKLSIERISQIPKLNHTPGAFHELVQVAAVDLKPSGMSFQKPVLVSFRVDHTSFQRILDNGGHLEVGHHNGNHWLREDNFRFNGSDIVTVEVTHFSKLVLIAVTMAVVLTAVIAWSNFQDKADYLTKPWKYIVPDASLVKNHIRKGNVKLPKKINAKGPTSLGLGKGFKPFQGNRAFCSNGAQMLSKFGQTAMCMEVAIFTATLLRASGDPRFQNFIGVQGNATDSKTGKKIGHQWLEIKIDGKSYVVDTAETRDISLLPKEEAYETYRLEPEVQFTDEVDSLGPYLGLDVKKHQCDTLIDQGGNEGLRHIFNLGHNPREFAIEYNTFNIADQVVIKYEGKEVFDSVCVGTEGMVKDSVLIHGKAETIEVKVNAKCKPGDEGKDTDWKLKVFCP